MRVQRCRFAFLSTFSLSNRTPIITQILTLYQANAATLMLFSKWDKILIKNLYECKGYNAWQFMNKGSTKNSISRLLVKFSAESGRQTTEPPNSQRNFTWGRRIHRSSVLQITHKVQLLQEKAHLTADWSTQHARVIFGMQFERQ